jgi:hypothetical protein
MKPRRCLQMSASACVHEVRSADGSRSAITFGERAQTKRDRAAYSANRTKLAMHSEHLLEGDGIHAYFTDHTLGLRGM